LVCRSHDDCALVVSLGLSQTPRTRHFCHLHALSPHSTPCDTICLSQLKLFVHVGTVTCFSHFPFLCDPTPCKANIAFFFRHPGISMHLIRRHEGHKEVKTDQYWAFGYYLETLNDKQKHQRREYLDWYGFVAQWSVLAIFVLFQIAFLIQWTAKSGLKYEAPKSPSFTKRPTGKLGWIRKLQNLSTKANWWMSKDVIRGWDWGTRGEWIGGSLWTIWLLYLCIAKTGNGKYGILVRWYSC
jgi:hypothetical protein